MEMSFYEMRQKTYMGCNKMRGLYKPVLLLALLLVAFTPVHAWMFEMADEELSEVTGEGFSSFTLENDVVHAFFDITVSTYTEIDSLKMGYYDDGITTGWDQDWTDVSLGSASEDLVCRGLFIEAGFQNIADPDSRRLSTLRIGTPDMTGPISANFVSFSGHIENPTDGVLVDGRRLNLGVRTIYSTNSEFSVSLDRDAGWSFYWNNATITP